MILMSDILTALLAGITGGAFGYWARSRKTAPADPNACTCGDPRGFHLSGKGKCNRTHCPCLQFDGPERPEDIIRGFQP